MASFFALTAIWAVWCVGGILLARWRRRTPLYGCLWSLLLGPIGWLIVALSGPGQEPISSDGRTLRKCPFCAEMILAEATICRYCHKESKPQILEINIEQAKLARAQTDKVYRIVIAVAILTLLVIIVASAYYGKT